MTRTSKLLSATSYPLSKNKPDRRTLKTRAGQVSFVVPGFGPHVRARERVWKLDGVSGQVNPLNGPGEEESCGIRIPLQLGLARPIPIRVAPVSSLLE